MSASSAHPGISARSYRTAIQETTLVAAAVFALVGILGFIPGITTRYSELAFAGADSGAMLFGIFQVSVLHNIVHLLFGAVGLLMARTVAQSKYFLIGGGVVYLVIWLYGLFIDQAGAANFIPVNTADNWLHLSLGVVMIALGLLLGRGTVSERRTM
ncbi:DUF4383 domain-containing protein [Sinomonas halotolerans]|uniref:DUF4383 domain-containing protein n=1 Tax=Sinomonas halotolerans TaxID=1644133 RepID=A0ABU9X203_9MICC